MNEGTVSLEKQALLFSQSLEASLNAYRRLLDLEEAQAASIAEADIEGVAAKIDSKNSLLEDLKKSDKELHDQHLLWQQVRDQAPDPLRKRLQDQVNALQQAMTTLLDRQRANEESLKKHGEAIHLKLRELQRGKAARRIYQQSSPESGGRPSKFYDQSH